MTKVFNPLGVELNSKEIADYANLVHRIAGGKGSPFSKFDFYGSNSRLNGCLCDCGCNEKNESLGEFVLYPSDSEMVRSGGKAYMECRKCGCVSHL